MHEFFNSIWNAHLGDALPIVAAIIAALVGGMVGGFFVHWLTGAKRQQAPRDSDNEEWRELLSALIKIEMYQSDRNLPVTR